MVYQEENYTFNGFRAGGPTFSRGGGQMLISIETHRTYYFP